MRAAGLHVGVSSRVKGLAGPAVQQCLLETAPWGLLWDLPRALRVCIGRRRLRVWVALSLPPDLGR